MTRNRLTCWVCWAIVALAATFALAPVIAEAGPLDAAKKALDAGDYETAAKRYQKVFKKDKSRAAALGLAVATTKGKLDDNYLYDAGEALDGLLEANEADWEATLQIGEVYLIKASRQRNPQMLRGYYEDARENFGRTLARQPGNEQAAVGMVQALYSMGDFVGAEDAVDKFIAGKPKNAARAWFWKGQVIYIQAGDAFRVAGNQLTDEVKKLYVEARKAYAESTRADGSRYDAWMQLAYAAQWSHDGTTAHEAYMKAIETDKASKHHLPLKGLLSLHRNSPDVMTRTLAELLEKHPKHQHVLLYAIFDHFSKDRLDEAKALSEAFVKVVKKPAQGYYYLGQIAERRDEFDDAAKAYAKALKATPDYEDVAKAWANIYLNAGNMQTIVSSWDKADIQKLISKYQVVLKAAPKAVDPRNNLGFLLREVYVGHGGAATWDEILKIGTTTYQEATDIIGDWDPALAQTYAYVIRYQRAQVISDTALMYQFYAPTKDLERAEKLYLRALEWSDSGYFDAWNNLRKMYESQERYDDLYDLASLCADGLMRLSGWKAVPNEEARAQARGVMDRLLKSGKVKDE